MERIGVVIPVADRNDEITKKCVDHLEKTQEFPYEPILIEERGPSFSFGKSMNRGIREAKGEIVIGMDSDAFPRKGAIEKLVEFSERYPEVGYFGVRVKTGHVKSLGWLYADRPLNLLNTLGVAIGLRSPLYFLREVRKFGLFPWDIRSVNRFVPGMVGQITAFYMIRRACWEDVGGFDESFWCYWVDVDLCFRILLSEKWRITTCPYVVADHVAHSTTKGDEKYWQGYIDSRNLFDRKWPHERILEVVEASKRGKFVIPK